jgi:CheY-like chemotaxis protein
MLRNEGPIVIVEDDPDDIYIIQKALERLKVQNKLRFFHGGSGLLDYLLTTEELPFIIICDINLPKINGTEIKEKVNKDSFLRKKSIPFIFLSTTKNPVTINKAYELIVQGFFHKPDNFEEMVSMMKIIIDYWLICKHPEV